MNTHSFFTTFFVSALGIAALPILLLVCSKPAAASPTPADCSKVAFPGGAAHGQLAGAPFVPETVTLRKTGSMEENGTHFNTWTLHFEQPEGDISFGRSADIHFLLPAGKTPAGRRFRRVPGSIDKQPAMLKGLPEVQGWEFSDFKNNVDLDSNSDNRGSLRLAFAQAAGSKLSGKIYLCTSQAATTWLGGSFNIDISR